jgi:hypothetical protein
LVAEKKVRRVNKAKTKIAVQWPIGGTTERECEYEEARPAVEPRQSIREGERERWAKMRAETASLRNIKTNFNLIKFIINKSDQDKRFWR